MDFTRDCKLIDRGQARLLGHVLSEGNNRGNIQRQEHNHDNERAKEAQERGQNEPVGRFVERCAHPNPLLIVDSLVDKNSRAFLCEPKRYIVDTAEKQQNRCHLFVGPHELYIPGTTPLYTFFLYTIEYIRINYVRFLTYGFIIYDRLYTF